MGVLSLACPMATMRLWISALSTDSPLDDFQLQVLRATKRGEKANRDNGYGGSNLNYRVPPLTMPVSSPIAILQHQVTRLNNAIDRVPQRSQEIAEAAAVLINYCDPTSPPNRSIPRPVYWTYVLESNAPTALLLRIDHIVLHDLSHVRIVRILDTPLCSKHARNRIWLPVR